MNVLLISFMWIVAGVCLSVLFGYFCKTGRGSVPYSLEHKALYHCALPSLDFEDAQPRRHLLRGSIGDFR